eukprot:Phypoly_transcript_03058.p1 GENE.Phypoly_transcript_03058~~Phypoly_transcript_03058.p1  ORF type:complete len:746 (+),score=135.76 Phypoly_transcript_03058:269-2506(+)
MNSTSPPPEESYGVVPLSSGPSPPNQDLYPRLNKKARNSPDIERWTPYNPPVRQYFALYDARSEEIGSTIDVHTKIDKVDQREHYSAADEAYILYRQNQFQLDVDMFGTLGNYSSNPPTPSASSSSAPVASTAPLYVDGGGVLIPVECLYYHIYSVKQHKGVPVETSTEPESLVDLVQLGGPRNRKDFQLPGLCPIVTGRATYGRLQFRAATPNNARVHPDQPNPNQQYYRIVLSLVAKTSTSLNFIFSKISPCFMVRGQNPGKFNTMPASSKPLTPPTPVPKQEFNYPPPSPFTPQQPLQNFDPQLSPPHANNLSPHSNSLSPNPNNYGPTLSPNSNSTPYQQTPTTTTTSYATFQPVNPNPAQLPVLVAHTPTSPNSSLRGVKRATMAGGEGWSSDQYGNVYTDGKVGINTKNPQEALSVQGNILVTGDVLKPSDERIKTNITPLSTSTQLQNVEKLKLYEYELKHSVGPDGQPVRERGVLAQELQTVMPEAVRVLKNVTLADGTIMPELLVVHDRALLFENIGATQALSRSVNEQRSRMDALSDSFAHGMHEVQVGTRKAMKAMALAMSFMLTEKKYDYETSCFFLSVFGLGPAWTMYLLGFFLPPLWFFGLFYISSIVSVKKTAGFIHLSTLIVYVIYAGFILAWDLYPLTKIFAILVPAYMGVIITIVFGVYWCRKMNERELRGFVSDGFLEEYDSASSRDSVSLLLPPEAITSWNNKQLEYGAKNSEDLKGKKPEKEKV